MLGLKIGSKVVLATPPPPPPNNHSDTVNRKPFEFVLFYIILMLMPSNSKMSRFPHMLPAFMGIREFNLKMSTKQFQLRHKRNEIKSLKKNFVSKFTFCDVFEHVDENV